MRDRFGVPESMFGPVPDDFYAVVGRIVLVATLVEDRTLTVLWALDDAPQDTHAGRSASEIRREITGRVSNHAAVLGNDLVNDLTSLLADLSEASEGRNAVVHSLWPNPSDELAQGWRSVRQPRGAEPRSEISWTLTSLDGLRKDLTELIELHERLVMLANKVWGVRGTTSWQ